MISVQVMLQNPENIVTVTFRLVGLTRCFRVGWA